PGGPWKTPQAAWDPFDVPKAAPVNGLGFLFDSASPMTCSLLPCAGNGCSSGEYSNGINISVKNAPGSSFINSIRIRRIAAEAPFLPILALSQLQHTHQAASSSAWRPSGVTI